jgi:hypothetical protein
MPVNAAHPEELCVGGARSGPRMDAAAAYVLGVTSPADTDNASSLCGSAARGVLRPRGR